MARRRYSRRNPLTQTEMIVGGLVTAGLVGLGGYLLYTHFNPSTTATASSPTPAQLNAGLVAANAASGQTTLPGDTGVTVQPGG